MPARRVRRVGVRSSSSRVSTSSACSAHGGHYAQFGVGQGVKAVHPDSFDAAQTLRGDLRGSGFQTAGAHGEPPSRQFPVHFPVDGEKRFAEGSVGETGREARAIAAGGGKFLDRVGQRFAEAVKADDAGKLGARDALRSLFDEKVEYGGGDFGGAARIIADEAGEGLDEGAAEYEALACEAILEVLRHGRGGHKQADGRISSAQCMAQAIENVSGFTGAGGTREQPHRLQCNAGRRKNEKASSSRLPLRRLSWGDVLNAGQPGQKLQLCDRDVAVNRAALLAGNYQSRLAQSIQGGGSRVE